MDQLSCNRSLTQSACNRAVTVFTNERDCIAGSLGSVFIKCCALIFSYNNAKIVYDEFKTFIIWPLTSVLLFFTLFHAGCFASDSGTADERTTISELSSTTKLISLLLIYEGLLLYKTCNIKVIKNHLSQAIVLSVTRSYLAKKFVIMV